MAEKRWLLGTGTLNGRIDMLLLLPNIVLVLDASLLPELPVRCSNCSILEVTEAELGRKWTIAAMLLLLGRGARNHSGSCSAPSIDNRINVASTQALQVGWLPANLHPIKTLASSVFCNFVCVIKIDHSLAVKGHQMQGSCPHRIPLTLALRKGRG